MSVAIGSTSIIPVPPACFTVLAFSFRGSRIISSVQTTIFPLTRAGSKVSLLQKLNNKREIKESKIQCQIDKCVAIAKSE